MKPCVDHAPADRGDDLRAQHDVGVHALAAQVEEAVAQAHVLAGSPASLVDLERQRLGRRLQRRVPRSELDLAGRQLGVDGLRRARDDLAGDGHDAFEPQRLDRLEQRRSSVDHALGDAVMVAQVDEQQIAVVALAVDPAGERGLSGRHRRRAARRRYGSGRRA